MSLALQIVLKRAHDVKHPAVVALAAGAMQTLHDVEAAFECGIMVGGVPAEMSADWVAEQIDQKIDAWLSGRDGTRAIAETFAPVPPSQPEGV